MGPFRKKTNTRKRHGVKKRRCEKKTRYSRKTHRRSRRKGGDLGITQNMIESFPSCDRCARAIKNKTRTLSSKIANQVKTSVGDDNWSGWTDADVDELGEPKSMGNKSLKLKIPSDELTPFEDSPNFKTPSPYERRPVIKNENPYGRRKSSGA